MHDLNKKFLRKNFHFFSVSIPPPSFFLMIEILNIAHTSENLYDVTIKVITRCQLEFEYFVYSFVKNNSANIEKI